MAIVDLPDDRRAAKTWLPESDKDVSEGRVVQQLNTGKPACVIHGAMHRIDPVEYLYRCSECGVGARWYAGTSKAFEKAWDARFEEGEAKCSTTAEASANKRSSMTS